MVTVKNLFLLWSAFRDSESAKATPATKKEPWGGSVFPNRFCWCPNVWGSAQWLFSIDWPHTLQFPW